MGDKEEDFSNLPLPERFAHKVWKVRKEAYEAATKEFKTAQPNSPIVREFTQDSGLWKAAVADSNVAAQQEALIAYGAFLEIAGPNGASRTRSHTIQPIVEKGLTGRPAAKAAALEALLLLIELDKAEPVMEELLPFMTHKQPKVTTAALAALTAVYHAYGVKTVEPKPVIKLLPKPYGHADKNVRAEAQNLTVELYRWLKDAMKPLFWGELKPVQQTDLEKLFEKVKDEPPPKQERLLRSQQEAAEMAAEDPSAGQVEDEAEDDEAAVDLEPEFEAVDVFAKMPKDLNERLGSSKWKDRKEVLEEVHTAVNHPAIQEGPFDDLIRGLAKSMKDANIAVVTIAANIVEILANGLKKSFAKYRSSIVSPILERFKEKKQSVTDALAAALDAVAAATSIQDNIEEILEFMKHKNPLVKLETARFLTRSLKATKQAPNPPEIKPMADAAIKLLTESLETTRNAGAEVLGVLWKIMGDRNMLAHLDGLDEIRKTKVKEYCDQAEVKSKWKPKAAPPPKPAAAPAAKKPALGKRPAPVAKKAAPPVRRPVTPMEEPEEPAPATTPLAARPTSRPATKLAPKGLQRPGIGGLKKPGSSIASPRKPAQPAAPVEEDPPTPAPRVAAPGRSLAARPLGKPNFGQSIDTPPIEQAPQPPTHNSTLSNAERAELSDLRSEVEYLRQQNSDLRTDKLKLGSQIHELQNQNAQLIEDHTRDVLGIKAKETQLVRARSDAEAAEERASALTREVERLKREVGRLGRQEREDAYAHDHSNGMNGSMRFDGGGFGANLGRPSYGGTKSSYQQSHNSFGSRDHESTSEGKENIPDDSDNQESSQPQRKLSPTYGLLASRAGSNGHSRDHSSSGRNSPASLGGSILAGANGGAAPEARSSMSRTSSDGVESWRRAAEVTQNLKARIEMMKAKQASLANRHA
ncbi:hypothetical protein AAFC00_004768 [Neodothiora populina]|uniref:TOG domain-containing protein n=1 Tax=Neodothiora populina TaxID=2781224 RepID=A0ABR3P3E5_9PEZI